MPGRKPARKRAKRTSPAGRKPPTPGAIRCRLCGLGIAKIRDAVVRQDGAYHRACYKKIEDEDDFSRL